MTLSEILTDYLREHKMSQREFAKRCNLTNGYIAMLVKNRNPRTGAPIIPTLATLNQLAKGMGMTIDQLIATADDMPVRLSDVAEPTPEDEAVWAIRESLRRNPELQILFDASKNAAAEDLLEAAELIEARKTIRSITERK